MIKKLESMGFVFVRKRTHYIFDFPVHGKNIRFEIAGTPGDFRSGIKKACVISRTIKKEAGLQEVDMQKLKLNYHITEACNFHCRFFFAKNEHKKNFPAQQLEAV